MKEAIKIVYNQSLIDVSIQEFVDIETAFDLSIKNNISITDTLNPSASILTSINEAKENEYFTKVNRTISTIESRSFENDGSYFSIVDPLKSLLTFVGYNQSNLDLSIQESGTIESVFELLTKRNISITDQIEIGSQLDIEFSITNADIKEYYDRKSLKPATGFYEAVDLSSTLFEVGLFEAGLFE